MIKGQKINDRYEIIRNIGEGGMANVYLAYDIILNRNVAVKVLRGDLANDEKFVRRFQREANSASSLHHPNIVEMYDVGEDDSKYYIVMEFIDGKTLKNLIKKRGALTLLETIDIMTQLTSAIACAHDKYIIHRDIKPQNVMILDDGRVKITDFGIAMALNSQELTQTNSVMGSVHYLAPEQASGGVSTIKCDIYSLGILMYELITGKLPFKGDNAVEIAIKQMNDAIPSVRKNNPSIPQSIENIILKACAKNPKNRYNNINEMNNDLKHALDEEHKDDKLITYAYPEQDLEETKVMKPMGNVVEAPVRENKKLNLAIIISSIFLFVLIGIMCFIMIIYPKINKVEDITIPDVLKMSILEAEEALKAVGFEIKSEYVYQPSNVIEEGKIIKTSPVIGAKRKKGTEIKLYVSSGKSSVTVEDYTGKNYYEIEASLKIYRIHVTVERKAVEEKGKYKENIIMGQSVEKGVELKEGEQIILFIPDIITTYPDFLDGTWSLSDIKAFCNEYGVLYKIKEVERTDISEGTIISVSRAAGDKVVEGASLTITASKLPSIDIDDIVPTE